MGSLYPPPLRQKVAASGRAEFLELNWQPAMWVVIKLKKMGGGICGAAVITIDLTFIAFLMNNQFFVQ